ncbi:MAG: helix-turn-helix domain-containing protein [Zoogloeaceae bacterium]|jgi:transcriptional regulator with XRE-family HTH domain|nr:helix-turn-helix domain-containing protein [Zoogloeaceae bacterium]
MLENNLKNLASAVGGAVARQRIRSGLTQEDVAERLNVGSEAISRIERGIVIPNIARLFEFATIFGCDAAELLTGASPRPGDQASRIGQLLATLDPADRQMIMEWVERLAERLGQTSGAKIKI